MVGLRGAHACMLDVCAAIEPPSLWVILGVIVFALVLATAVGLAVVVAQLAMGRDPGGTFVVARLLGGLTLGASVAAIAYAVIAHGGTPSLGPLAAIAGGVAAWIAGAADRAEAAPAALAAPPAAPAAMVPRRGSALDAAHGELRFVATAGTLTATGVRVEVGGAPRDLAWTEVTRVEVHRLPPDPPYEKAAFLDLVTATGPVRITAASRVDYPSLPGGAAPNTKENWRRLVAHARATHPAIAIAPAAAPFFAGGEAPMFAAWKLFLAYDKQYG